MFRLTLEVFSIVGCFIVSYVTLGMLVASDRPSTWKETIERVAMAATVGFAVLLAITPHYLPWWALLFNSALGGWFWFMFHRDHGWIAHLKESWVACAAFLKGIPSRINTIKKCWNARVDKMRGDRQ